MPLRYTAVMRRWAAGIGLVLALTMVLAVGGYFLMNSRSFQLAGRMVDRTDAEIRRTGYRGPITFRPPYGKKLWTLPKYLSEHGRTTVTWDVEPDSARDANADQIVAETVDAVRPGSIILLHVMYEGRAASRAAIPRIVDELRADGYRFVTVSDLITR